MSSVAAPFLAGDPVASVGVLVDAITPNNLLFALAAAAEDLVLQLALVLSVLDPVALEEEIDSAVAVVGAEVSEVIEEAVASVEGLVEVVEEVVAMEVTVAVLASNRTATDLPTVPRLDPAVLATLVEATGEVVIEAEATEMEEDGTVTEVTDVTMAVAVEDPVERTMSPWVTEIGTVTVSRVGMVAATMPAPGNVVMKDTTTTHDSAAGIELERRLGALCYGLSKGYLPFRLVF